MLIPYSFTGVTAELFAAARHAGVALRSQGPASDKVWVLLPDGGWQEAPRDAMPLLLGATELHDAVEAVRLVGGTLVDLAGDEEQDATELIYRASAQGGGRCR